MNNSTDSQRSVLKGNVRAKDQQFDLVNTLFLLGTPVLAITFSILHWATEGWSWGIFFLAVFYYYATGLAITAGYHRLFAHKTYQTHPVIKLFYLVFGAVSFQNSAWKWCSDHRVHHRDVDKDADPYNINRGFFYAHMGWILYNDPKVHSIPLAIDLGKDPLVRWQHKYYLPLAVVFGIILPWYIGYLMGHPWGGLGVVALLRLVLVHHATFFINSLCHYVGKSNYTNVNSAKDSFLMAFFTFGEGFHNFHHKFQTDYRNGIRWYHFDPGKWIINFLSWVGLANRVRKVSDLAILRARLEMEERLAVEKLALKKESVWRQEFNKINENLKLKVKEAETRAFEYKMELDQKWDASVQNLRQQKAKLKYFRSRYNDSVSELRLGLYQLQLFSKALAV